MPGASRYETSYSATELQAGCEQKGQGGWIVESRPRRLGDIGNGTVLMTEKELFKTMWSNYATCGQFSAASETNSPGCAHFVLKGASFRHGGKTNFLFKEGNVNSFKLRANIVYDEHYWNIPAWAIRP